MVTLAWNSFLLAQDSSIILGWSWKIFSGLPLTLFFAVNQFLEWLQLLDWSHVLLRQHVLDFSALITVSLFRKQVAFYIGWFTWRVRGLIMSSDSSIWLSWLHLLLKQRDYLRRLKSHLSFFFHTLFFYQKLTWCGEYISYHIMCPPHGRQNDSFPIWPSPNFQNLWMCCMSCQRGLRQQVECWGWSSADLKIGRLTCIWLVYWVGSV